LIKGPRSWILIDLYSTLRNSLFSPTPSNSKTAIRVPPHAPSLWWAQGILLNGGASHLQTTWQKLVWHRFAYDSGEAPLILSPKTLGK
jgi:hypothetical protein